MAKTIQTNLIPLTNGYYFTADENQYILYECGTRKKIDRLTRKETDEDIEYQDTIGYYGSLSAMLRGCVQVATRRNIKLGNLTSLNDAIEFMDGLYEELDKLVKKN